MSSHLLAAGLDKPEALGSDEWLAIRNAFDRLCSAVKADDRPLAVGSAKDLVECTAHVVLSARGQQPGNKLDYEPALNAAHKTIEYQPGPGIALNAPVRQIAEAALKMARNLRYLRNDFGTGHGRATVPTISEEVVETSIDGALLWTRWALRRLHFYLIGDVEALVRDLHGRTFTRGKLAVRLQAVDLPRLSESDQRRLGVAVGQRASSNTGNVQEDGVYACILNPDSATWPLHYREGLVEGLFLDKEGHITVDDQAKAPQWAAEALRPHPDPRSVLSELQIKMKQAAAGWGLSRNWRGAVAEIERAKSMFDEPAAQSAWLELAEVIRTAAGADEVSTS